MDVVDSKPVSVLETGPLFDDDGTFRVRSHLQIARTPGGIGGGLLRRASKREGCRGGDRADLRHRLNLVGGDLPVRVVGLEWILA